MRNEKLKYALFVCLSLLGFASCSEEDDTAEEFANWQSKNETYFEQAYQEHLAASSATCFVLKSYTKADNLKLEEVAHTDCILVDVLPSDFTVEGDKATSPLYTDVTEVHYCGKLLPSLSYSNGYQFDSSYSGSFSEQTAEPVELSPNGTIAGFSTALQHMHRGDHWLITIPYQMGYGVSGSSSIPGYSTLIFEIRMVDFTSDQGNG